jgi:hypothetical protein
MDETQVEQVAQAFHGVESSSAWKDEQETIREQYRRLARMAIGTMVEEQQRVKSSWIRLTVPSRPLENPEQSRSWG